VWDHLRLQAVRLVAQVGNKLCPAVFLDRDGVLNEDLGYAVKLEDLRLLPGVGPAVVQLRKKGYLLIVVSNQSGVARGKFHEEDVRRFNAELNRRLISEAVHYFDGSDGFHGINGFYYCPHHPEGVVPGYASNCDCRKPAPGMILQAAAEHGVDLAASYMVGDKPDDMECAQRAGVVGIQVKSRYGAQHPHAVAYVDSLLAAVPYIR
jgi:D-glycero-D-manno-heptose 1,7-bisphosphate phosphatase